MRIVVNSALLFGVVGITLLITVPAQAQEPSTSYVIKKVRELLKKPEGLPLDIRKSAPELLRYYSPPDSKLLWVKTQRSAALLAQLDKLEKADLARTRRTIERLRAMGQAMRSFDADILALAEVVHSAYFVRLVSDLRLGQMSLYRNILHPSALNRKMIAKAVLNLVGRESSLAEVLEQLQPREIDYRAIKQRLEFFAHLSERGGWRPIRLGRELRVGASENRVIDVRRRLVASGELAKLEIRSPVYDDVLAAAVRLFQRRHNLPQTGNLDRRTVFAMNVPLRDRMRQLRVNLERWRWFDDPERNPRWIINTAAQKLFWRHASGKSRELKIRAGQSCQKHAAFNAIARRVVPNPHYTVRPQVAARHLLPLLKSNAKKLNASFAIYADPSETRSGRIDWHKYDETHFPFTVVQRPSPSNPLGRLQVPFDKVGDVSLHGRPSARPLPQLRHACVAMAEKQLQSLSSLLPTAQIAQLSAPDDTSASTRSRELPLKNTISVVFIYATVWLDEDGELVYGADPLGKDVRLLRLILGGRLN